MPELPEVEVVKRGLARRLIGKKIDDIEVRYEKSFSTDSKIIRQYIIGATVTDVERYQKMILIDLSTNWTLVIHLKMTGQLVFLKQGTGDRGQVKGSINFAGGHPEKVYEQPLPHKHTHVIFHFKDDGTLYFNDLRKFGWIRAFRRKSSKEQEFPLRSVTDRASRGQAKIRKTLTLDQFLESFNYSPDPLSENWLLRDFEMAFKNRSITVKQILMDQRVAAGVGNIYADEALFCAKILPMRKAKTLKNTQIKKLYQCIKSILETGIKYGGTTKNNFRTVGGTSGGMQHHLKVYGREGKQCYECKGLIQRRKIGGRSAHFCPSCQK